MRPKKNTNHPYIVTYIVGRRTPCCWFPIQVDVCDTASLNETGFQLTSVQVDDRKILGRYVNLWSDWFDSYNEAVHKHHIDNNRCGGRQGSALSLILLELVANDTPQFLIMLTVLRTLFSVYIYLIVD
jgi:hypothetical protein